MTGIIEIVAADAHLDLRRAEVDTGHRNGRSEHRGNLKFDRVGQIVAEKIRGVVTPANGAQLARAIELVAHGAQNGVVIFLFLRKEERGGSGEEAGDGKRCG